MPPERLQKPWFLVPLCIFSLTVGLMLLSYLVFPEISPRAHQNLVERNLAPLAGFFGLLCVLLPVGMLFWATRKENEKAEGSTEDDESFY